MGSHVAAAAYQQAAANITADDLTHHYTKGLAFFHDEFVPHLRQRMHQLTGGAWDLRDYVAYAAGSDVDLMMHLVNAVAARETIALYPGDWYGFLVGSTHQEQFKWTRDSQDQLACLCLPSVRNGQLTHGMKQFLTDAKSCLLNINLFPTLEATERATVAEELQSILPKSVLSISFSRGFGLTASQLGVFLLHKDHPYRQQFEQQWNWTTYFFNMIAAKAFMAIDAAQLEAVDNQRRAWVQQWLETRQLPYVSSGSYYVKSFRVEEPLPPSHQALQRGDVVRLCFKPTLT